MFGGLLRAPGGPFLYDQQGRVVLLHGVNAVYKRWPYELFPAAGSALELLCGRRLVDQPARLQRRPARHDLERPRAGDGSSQRSGHLRQGQPERPPAVQPGRHRRLPQQAEAHGDLLGSYGIYTILDMHQDVYNHLFDGEGAPSWAVCTDGVKLTDPPGRWSNSYASGAAGAAYRNFWTNDVAGNLQGEYDRVWGDVAAYFRGDPWVAGYDPFNEPFSTSLVDTRRRAVRQPAGLLLHGHRFASAPAHGVAPIPCPKTTRRWASFRRSRPQIPRTWSSTSPTTSAAEAGSTSWGR